MSGKRQRIDDAATGGAGKVMNLQPASGSGTNIADAEDVKVARAKRGLSRKHAEFQGVEEHYESNDEDTQVGTAELPKGEDEDEEQDEFFQDPMIREVQRLKEEERKAKNPAKGQKIALKRVKGEVDSGPPEEEEPEAEANDELDELDADLGGDGEPEPGPGDDIQITPFNLNEERKQGYYNERGDYVVKGKIKDEEDDFNDPWLKSIKNAQPMKGKVCITPLTHAFTPLTRYVACVARAFVSMWKPQTKTCKNSMLWPSCGLSLIT